MTPTLFADLDRPRTRGGIVPREYQTAAHDDCLRLWDAGEPGALARLFTGGGKTLTACLIADTWLRRGDNYRVLVVSYETQLVWQFAQEIEDYLGIKPGIEMEKEAVPASRLPQLVVASRASLLLATPPDAATLDELAGFGVRDLGACPGRLAQTYLRHLRRGGEVESVLRDVAEKNARPEADGAGWSRLHKFDWRLNWLVIFDEAHRHARKLVSVGHIADWFERNPVSRRLGLTATPKRGDGVSIGDKMFPGVAVDYPLYSASKPCAVKEGYAVPYVQKYIEVEGVDFRQIKRVTEGGDFDEAALEFALGQEAQLTKLVGPLLDMVGDRRALVFSPGVEMAKNVARFINARSEARCGCGLAKWYPKSLIGDGAACDCGRFIDPSRVAKGGDQARQLDGMSPPREREVVYRGHQSGEFQFLSVCGLCREGYNDPDISCVAVFRPVSKKAASLAEQMKGRGCRPLRDIAGILHTLPDAAARVRAIAESAKPNCLIVDLVGITGLADCASTVEVYADGLPDEVKQRAQEILTERGAEGEAGVEEAIEQAKRESEEARERVRAEREEAERKAKEEYDRRSRADAQAKYTAHEVGHGAPGDPDMATEKQYRFMAFLGMQVDAAMHRKKAGRIISQLRQRLPLEEVARTNRLGEGDWQPCGPTARALGFARWKGVPADRARSGYDLSLLIDAKIDPGAFTQKRLADIAGARTDADLDAAGKDVAFARELLPPALYSRIAEAGRQKRFSLRGDEPIPD